MPDSLLMLQLKAGRLLKNPHVIAGLVFLGGVIVGWLVF